MPEMKSLMVSMVNFFRIYMLNMTTRLLKKVHYFIILMLVSGCVTAPPMTHEYRSNDNFPIPFNEAWELSNNFLTENVSAIDTADRKSGYIKTEEFNVPYEGFQYQSEYADCGTLGGLYVYHKIIGYYEIFIYESETNLTVVSAIPHYRASLWLGKSFKGWVPCRSRGYIEQLLMDDLGAKMQKSDPAVPQPENALDKEKDNNETGIAEPEINLTSDTELNNLMIKHETALQEIKKLNNEIIELKRKVNPGNNNKNPGEAELSDTESPL